MEMKNICGKIPVELHEKLKLEVEELGISIPKYLEMVIEEHMTRKGEKANMADLRTVWNHAVQSLLVQHAAVGGIQRGGDDQRREDLRAGRLGNTGPDVRVPAYHERRGILLQHSRHRLGSLL